MALLGFTSAVYDLGIDRLQNYLKDTREWFGLVSGISRAFTDLARCAYRARFNVR